MNIINMLKSRNWLKGYSGSLDKRLNDFKILYKLVVMKIDVLTHPYFTETVRFRTEKPLLTAEEKTQRWYQAIAELGPTDWLIVVASNADGITRRLTGELLQYARSRLGDRVVVYQSFLDDHVAQDLMNPHQSSIERIRGYGEIYGACVNDTFEVSAQLDPEHRVRLELPEELSVSLVDLSAFPKVYNCE